jgi:poly-gamma-glutamate synthesis protein (capsule biosynthesis protein)
LGATLLALLCSAWSVAAVASAPPTAHVAGISAQSARGAQPLAFVVHATRPPLALDWRQAFQLVAGTIDSWKPIDGRSDAVRLVLGPAAAARAAGLWILLGRAPRALTVAASEAAAADAVSRDPRAVGLVAGEAFSPAVRTATLAGVDPVRDPARYGLLVPGPPPDGPVITAVAFGDILTSRTVDRKMVALGDFTSPFRSVGTTLKAADLAFGNFEGTISRTARPRSGGTSFVSRVGVIEGFTSAGIDFLSLANNHTGDFGDGTLVETVELLRAAGIATAGAGKDDASARQPAVVERKGIRFGFVTFNAIIGTGAPSEDSPGAVRIRMAPWFPFSQDDVDRVAEDVRRARQQADVVIVYPHWGQEYVSRPNADQIRVARALIDAGADMLIATHPHWVQGAEIYKGHLIAYSLGNFVFDQTWSVETQQGATLDLVFWGRRLVAASFAPVQIEDAHRPRLLDYASGASILRRIWEASGEPYRHAA